MIFFKIKDMNNFNLLIERVESSNSKILKEYCLAVVNCKKSNYKIKIIDYLVKGNNAQRSDNYNIIKKNFKQKNRYENNIESLILGNVIIKNNDNLKFSDAFGVEYLKIKMSIALSELKQVINTK